jgi:hypothetical protein
VSNGLQNNGGRGVNDLDGLTVLTEPLIPVIDSGKFTTAVRRITPSDATYLLENRNPRNRGLRRRDSANQSRDVGMDNWEINGETVKFDWNGDVLDGQHRLDACRRANKPINTLVVTGLSPEVQATVDIGSRRTHADRLTIAGETNAVALASIARRVWAWNEGDLSFASNFAPTPAEMAKLIEDHPEIRVSTTIAVETYSAWPHIPKAVIGATHYVLADIDEDAARLFFQKLRTGAGLEVGHPIHTLREQAARLSKVTGENGRQKAPTFPRWVAYVFRAWNAYVEGRSMSIIRQPAGKPIPLPVGLKNTAVRRIAVRANEAPKK